MFRGLEATAVSLLIAGAVGATGLHIGGFKLLSVQTASMLPTFRPGDALFVAPVTSKNLRLGEIVSYHNPRNPNIVISHRLLAIDPHSGWLTTAGDARRTPDPAFPPNQLAGRAVALLPELGTLLNWMRTPIGLGLAIYLPSLIVILAEIRRLSSAYAQPFYSVRL